MAQTTTEGTEDRVLLILAADHRNSLERDLYGLTAPPTPAQAARISADKVLIYQALLDASEQLGAEVQPGILIDEQYGASVAELAASSGGAINLSMPIEASGQDWFHFAYDAAWRHHAEFFSTDHAKVLVRDNPGFDETEREEQAKRLSDVSTWAAKAGKSLIIELLVPASEQDMNDLADNTRLYEDTVRPDHMVSVIEYLQDRGVDPAIWKVEGLSHHSAAIAVAEAARRGGRQAKCIVLGRHASHDQLDRWLQVAAPIPGFVGFAIGRSIWWDALHSHLRHHGTAGDARRHITSNYLDFVNYYLAARDGDLTNPDPTFW